MTEQTLTNGQKEELTAIGKLYRNAIYNNENVSKILIDFSNSLKNLNGEISTTILSEILHFKTLVESRDFFCGFRNWIDELYDILLEKLPNTVSFTIDCRRKSVQSTVRKVIRNYLDGSSINLFDLVAFRIIIDSLDSKEKLEKYCYTVKDICNSFFQEKLCVLCTPNKQVGSDPLCKDYIEIPKDNGYQSIHLAFRTLENQLFELQIRTLDMHEDAEIGESGHEDYKDLVDQLVAEYISFDPKQVKIPHFRVFINNSIHDKIGLKDALTIN